MVRSYVCVCVYCDYVHFSPCYFLLLPEESCPGFEEGVTSKCRSNWKWKIHRRLDGSQRFNPKKPQNILLWKTMLGNNSNPAWSFLFSLLKELMMETILACFKSISCGTWDTIVENNRLRVRLKIVWTARLEGSASSWQSVSGGWGDWICLI